MRLRFRLILRRDVAHLNKPLPIYAHELVNFASGGSGNPVAEKRAQRGFYYRQPLFLRAFLLFFYRYIVKLGFLDGKEGLIFYTLQTLWFRFLVDAKLYERRKAMSPGKR